MQRKEKDNRPLRRLVVYSLTHNQNYVFAAAAVKKLEFV